jgi:hypothetical protein
MKETIKMNGEYQTIEQYAKANNISKRGARKRVERKSFSQEVVKFERLILIKIS